MPSPNIIAFIVFEISALKRIDGWNLTNVFNLCREHEKCSFFIREVTFLGHKCVNKGILSNNKK